ncbi:hypothetical protein D9M68_292780 [compost metagenome]
MEELKVVLMAAAFLLSVLALIFTRRTWFESNRPIITAEIVTASAGNVATAFNFVVHNTGNRPATNVCLRADESQLEAAISASANALLKQEILRCFSADGRIPLLHHQATKTNGFGVCSTNEAENALNYSSVIPITITYRDLYGKKYKSKQGLVVKDYEYFAASGWS